MKPAPLDSAQPAQGIDPHLLIESLSDAARAEFTHVPYQGSAATMPALLGGFVDFVCVDVSNGHPSFAMAVSGFSPWLRLDASRNIRPFRTLTELGYPQVRNIRL